MRPRQASELACVVLAGTKKDLRVQEFLWELVIGVAAPSDLAGSILVEILHSIESGYIEQVCLNLKTILPRLRLLISLTCIYILHAIIVCIFLYSLVFQLTYMLGLSVCSSMYSTKRVIVAPQLLI